MRRFTVHHRRGRERWQKLQPGVHDDLCAQPEIQRTIRFLRDNPSIEAVFGRAESGIFTLIAATFSDCYEFIFPED